MVFGQLTNYIRSRRLQTQNLEAMNDNAAARKIYKRRSRNKKRLPADQMGILI